MKVSLEPGGESARLAFTDGVVRCGQPDAPAGGSLADWTASNPSRQEFYFRVRWKLFHRVLCQVPEVSMFAFLKKQEKKDARDIEQLIFDIAEHQRDADFHLLYKLMVGREVFVGINGASLPTSITPGVPYETQPSDRLEMKTVYIPNHGAWSSAATLATHPLLANSYVGMQWLDFLRMTQKVPELQGAALQGKTSWVAFDKDRIAYVLARTGA